MESDCTQAGAGYLRLPHRHADHHHPLVAAAGRRSKKKGWQCMATKKGLNIGFVSFRFSGTDGVSLETNKWAEVLEEMGHHCFYFAGESDKPKDVSMVVDEAHFFHPEINKRHHKFWRNTERNHEDTLWIKEYTEFFYKHITKFVKEFDIDVFVPQNLFSYPLNIPLTMAVSEHISEFATPTIAHHHDFYWERKLFKVNSVWDYLTMIFPPTLNHIQHVVINSSARHQLAARKGLAATIIPNVMNFEKPAPEPDDYSKDAREAFGLEPDEKLILQPTRVVQRKGIEHAIELLSRLNIKARLVISHATADDEFGYNRRIRDYADLLKVNILFASHLIGEKRGLTNDGKKMYSLWDIYPFADLITYPSLFEGFGNAFLEAIYFKKPIVVNNYTIYETDIRTKGFRVIFFDDFITDDTVEQTHKVLDNPDLERENCQFNYQLALKYFSYTILRDKLKVLLNNIYGHE